MDSTAQWRLAKGLTFLSRTFSICAGTLEASLQPRRHGPEGHLVEMPAVLRGDMDAILKQLYLGVKECGELLPLADPTFLALAGSGPLASRIRPGTFLQIAICRWVAHPSHAGQPPAARHRTS